MASTVYGGAMPTLLTSMALPEVRMHDITVTRCPLTADRLGARAPERVDQ